MKSLAVAVSGTGSLSLNDVRMTDFNLIYSLSMAGTITGNSAAIMRTAGFASATGDVTINNTVLDRVTVSASNSVIRSDYGGFLYLSESSDVTVTEPTTVTITNTTIAHLDVVSGGALYLSNTSNSSLAYTISMENVTITSIKASGTKGGIIYLANRNEATSVYMNNVTIAEGIELQKNASAIYFASTNANNGNHLTVLNTTIA